MRGVVLIIIPLRKRAFGFFFFLCWAVIDSISVYSRTTNTRVRVFIIIESLSEKSQFCLFVCSEARIILIIFVESEIA